MLRPFSEGHLLNTACQSRMKEGKQRTSFLSKARIGILRLYLKSIIILVKNATHNAESPTSARRNRRCLRLSRQCILSREREPSASYPPQSTLCRFWRRWKLRGESTTWKAEHGARPNVRMNKTSVLFNSTTQTAIFLAFYNLRSFGIL